MKNKTIQPILIVIAALVGLFALWFKWDPTGIIINLSFTAIALFGIWELWFRNNLLQRKKKIVLTILLTGVLSFAVENLYLRQHKHFGIIGLTLIFTLILTYSEKLKSA